ncbi:uncharacterized protein [Clytia hemisphaerica]|uniref:Uncharacterized protein n=1 Tax=Clytia hemisphaerica TaxID=252671 RepID=A0A7M5WJ68_9CNID|eukprot:TCONS_00003940-protein
MGDTLPLHQTLSILSLFLLVTSLSISSYTQTQSDWMKTKLILKTKPFGEFITRKYFPKTEEDDLIPDFENKTQEDKDSQCDFLENFRETLLKYDNGKMKIDVNIGLKDMCMFIMFTGFKTYSEILPQFYSCKKFEFLNSVEEETANKVWDEDSWSRKMFDSTIDVIDEVSDLTVAGISFTIVAVLTAFFKTPLIRNFLKNRNIFQAMCAFCTFGASVAYTWAIVLFLHQFDPADILTKARTRAIDKKNEASDFWKTSRVKQNNGKSFYLLVGADAILVLVLIMSVVEYLSSRVVRRVPEEDMQMSREKLMAFDHGSDDSILS